MIGRRVVPLAGLALALAASFPAHAGPEAPTRIVPAKKKPRRGVIPPPGVDTSEAGTKRGALEITLGSLLIGLSGVLIGRGIWEIPRARALDDACAAGTTDDPACDMLENPGRTGRISAGLSFGFAVPIAVAGSLLLARGVRIHRDHRKWHRTHQVGLAPWLGSRGAGLGLRARF